MLTDNVQTNYANAFSDSEAAVNRQHKDRVFRLLFNNKKKLMELYNALNGTNYTNENDFTINTLDNAIFMSMKNDISFIVGSDMCLYEHQSTVCPNMPLRGLFYICELYKRIKDEKRLYSTTLIKIPTPHYIVFYNGTDNTEDIITQRLSDAFLNRDRESCIEVTATLINVNYGHNKELMKSCRTLQDYSYFISRIRYHMGKLENKDDKEAKFAAVSTAIDECIKQNVLADFLKNHRAEVTNMSIFEYDEEEAKQVFKEDGRIEGIAEGLIQGRAEGKSEGMLETRIASVLELLEDIGDIPEPLKNKICSEADMDTLKKWHKYAAKSNSIKEFENLIVQS